MDQNPSEEENAFTDTTRIYRDAARNCASPDGANSAAMRKTATIENLLFDTDCPKCRVGN